MTIKNLKIGSPHHRKRLWASQGEPDTGTVFTPRTPLPEIVVLIDAELMHDPAPSPFFNVESFNQEGLLSGLLLHRLVRLYRYAESGPPPEIQPDSNTGTRNVYSGWAVLEPEIPGREERSVIFRKKNEDSFTLGGIMGNAREVAAADVRSEAYGNLTPDGARRRRQSDALAAQVADQGVDADIYVTRREYLASASWQVARDATLCTPEEALTLLGLYLRCQNEYVVARDGTANLTMNRGLFTWVGTRELLADGWRWFAACVQHSSGSGDDRLTFLGQSLFQRFGRALEARDQVHAARNQPQNNDLMDEALANLDQVFLLLMSCVDITARVAHAVLGLTASERSAGWQNEEWLKLVKPVAPALASVVAPGTTNLEALNILRLLRNSVHGSALQGMSVMRGGKPMTNLVGLPAEDEAKLLAAMDRLGGRTLWSVEQLTPGKSHFEPATLVDLLFQYVIVILNQLMKETPVERLSHVNLHASSIGPLVRPKSSASSAWDPFVEWTRQSIRWQLGF